MSSRPPPSTFQAGETASGASGDASPLNLGLNERDFTRKVVDLFRARKWLCVHFRPAQTSKGWRTPFTGDGGFPDVVAARDRVVLFAELKAQNAKPPTPEQVAWLEAVPAGFLWRPSDMHLIEQIAAAPEMAAAHRTESK